MDNRPHPTKPCLARLHRSGHIVHVTNIGRGYQNFSSQRLKPLQRQYAVTDGIGRVVGSEITLPNLTLGQCPAGDQSDLDAKALNQIFGNRQTDATKSPGNQHMRAIWQAKSGTFGQELRLQALHKPPRSTQGGYHHSGVLQEFFQNLRAQSQQVSPCTAGGLGQIQIAKRHRHSRQLAWNDPRGPKESGFFGIGNPLAFHLSRTRCESSEVDRAG